MLADSMDHWGQNHQEERSTRGSSFLIQSNKSRRMPSRMRCRFPPSKNQNVKYTVSAGFHNRTATHSKPSKRLNSREIVALQVFGKQRFTDSHMAIGKPLRTTSPPHPVYHPSKNQNTPATDPALPWVNRCSRSHPERQVSTISPLL